MIQPVEQGALIAARLKGNQHQIDLLLLEQSRLIAEFAETEHWNDEGSASAYDWVRFNCNLTSGAVYDRAAVGEQMTRLAEGVRAVETQEIGFAHLVYLARAADATR